MSINANTVTPSIILPETKRFSKGLCTVGRSHADQPAGLTKVPNTNRQFRAYPNWPSK